MKITAAFFLFLFFPGWVTAQTPATTPESAATSLDSSANKALFEAGIPFGLFLDRAEKRREMWLGNFEKGKVPVDLRRRASELHGPYYLLAVAVDGCSDSVNTIPYLAHLDEATESIVMHLVSPEAGRHIMEAYKTPDGRPSTPTVLVLDSNFTVIDAFIERPKLLQDWALGSGKELSSSAFMTAKFAWYDEDLGRQTMSEVLDIIEKHEAKGGHNH
ncbi:MAG: thioredoxin family protein [Bacteroidetes bacterium]|nr:thioredoxin family protein [Bacteroidota bacterium]